MMIAFGGTFVSLSLSPTFRSVPTRCRRPQRMQRRRPPPSPSAPLIGGGARVGLGRRRSGRVGDRGPGAAAAAAAVSFVPRARRSRGDTSLAPLGTQNNHNRWWNHLNPAVKKGAFTDWEDAVIIKVRFSLDSCRGSEREKRPVARRPPRLNAPVSLSAYLPHSINLHRRTTSTATSGRVRFRASRHASLQE